MTSRVGPRSGVDYSLPEWRSRLAVAPATLNRRLRCIGPVEQLLPGGCSVFFGRLPVILFFANFQRAGSARQQRIHFLKLGLKLRLAFIQSNLIASNCSGAGSWSATSRNERFRSSDRAATFGKGIASKGGGAGVAVAGGAGVAGGVDSFLGALPVRVWASFSVAFWDAPRQLNTSNASNTAVQEANPGPLPGRSRYR